MFKEFKEFIARGNVLDLAVAVVIGAAFSKIVSSFVSDILMPPIGLILGKVDFSNLFLSLSGGKFATLDEAKKAGVPTLNYGVFLNNLIDFLIIAFAVFLVVKGVNRFKGQPIPAAPTTKTCPQCASQIPVAAKKCPFCTSSV